MISSKKDDATRQNEFLKKELALQKSQSEAAIKKANDDAQRQIEEAQAGLASREKELGLRLALQVKELLGECLHCYRLHFCDVDLLLNFSLVVQILQFPLDSLLKMLLLQILRTALLLLRPTLLE